MIKKSYYSIIIVRDRADKLSKHKISNIALYTVLFAFLAVLVVSASMLYNYLTIRLEMMELTSLREENRVQGDQIKIFEEELDDLSGKLERLRDANDAVCTMLSIKAGGGGPELFGIGGSNNGDREETKRGDDDEINASELMADMLKFENDSKRREESLQELLVFLEDQGHLLDSTPSIWPTKGFLCSTFGFRRDPINRSIKMHEGYDIANKVGTPVFSTADGIVIFAGIESGYGNMVTVDHGYGVTTNYAHLSSIRVRLGERVKRGQKLGLIGSTGRSIGSHLHYEVRINRVPVDPANFILN
jgi:hypothetical protein